MTEAILYKKNPEDDSVNCLLCSHYCKISANHTGICKVRQNIEGKLIALNYGLIQGTAIDPIEKKPLYHYYPGSKVLSFGLPGCNFSCLNCQNSELSQEIKSDKRIIKNTIESSPMSIIESSLSSDILGIAFTYSEPTIFFEYIYDTIKYCRENSETSKYKFIWVSNGYFSSELLEIILKEQLIDAINIDLKFSNEEQYRKITGGSLKPVLNNIKTLYESGIHVEVTNLVIPDENDSFSEIIDLIGLVRSISVNIPLHFSRFYPRYKMIGNRSTDPDLLLKAREMALSAGMKYVYIGNTNLEGVSNTYCPDCKSKLIERNGYKISQVEVIAENNQSFCRKCRCPVNMIL